MADHPDRGGVYGVLLRKTAEPVNACGFDPFVKVLGLTEVVRGMHRLIESLLASLVA